MSTVVPLRKPAYTPMGPPGRCMTPGHEGQDARLYPGGRLCDQCIAASRRAYTNSSDEKGDAA